MKKYINLIITILTLVIELCLIVYGLYNSFNEFINISLIIIAIVGFGTVYLLNSKYSIYGGKFNKHFKD